MNQFIHTHFAAPEKDRDRHFTLCHKATGPIVDGEYPTCPICQKMARPNKNYILQLMRDWDMGDPWGTAMAWAGACAENLAYIGADVWPGLQYRPSIIGPIIESAEDFEVAFFIGTAEYDEAENEPVLIARDIAEIWDADMEARVSEVQEAAKILDRFLDWCVAAGRDY